MLGAKDTQMRAERSWKSSVSDGQFGIEVKVEQMNIGQSMEGRCFQAETQIMLKEKQFPEVINDRVPTVNMLSL